MMKKLKFLALPLALIAILGFVACSSDDGGGSEKSGNTQITPQGFVKVSGTTFDGTSTLTPESKVFISGRSITIGDLYVCDHEVTQGEYETYCKYGSSSPSSAYGDGDNYPAYYVSWYDAIVYCNLRSIAEGLTPAYSISSETDPSKWTGIVSETTDGKTKYCGPSEENETWDVLSFNESANGYRLPTEAEWEYVARGGNKDSYTYSGSDTIGDVAWYTGNSSSSAHKVKTKKANSLGIYDMSGNVNEWCYDWYCENITTRTAATGVTTGEGYAYGSFRINRGGSWDSWESAVSLQLATKPFVRSSSVLSDAYGFRVVRNAE